MLKATRSIVWIVVVSCFVASFVPAGNTAPALEPLFFQSSTGRQPASPRGQAQFTFPNGRKIVVDYGRPYVRGRKIMGGLVPYGRVWRTGANAATGFVTEAELLLAGTRVPAGKYTLYTIPGEQFWTIIINKQTGQWGLTYNQSLDLARVPVKPVPLSQAVDQFTISFEPRGTNAVVMKLEWENTSLPVEFTEEQK